MSEKIKEFIKQYPNDTDLGKQVRARLTSDYPFLVSLSKIYPNDQDFGRNLRLLQWRD